MIFLSSKNKITTIKLNSINKIGILLVIFLCFSACNPDLEITKEVGFVGEEHRPQLHFTPKTGWMNDPNGMVYFNGIYHLFYQYYPDSTVWGPMHWGHATSENLVHWEHQPIALYPDSLGWIFSGSAVYDQNNTSGLGKNGQGPLVAIFTHHSSPIEKTGSDLYQYQSIAYSNDEGQTWTSYENNPVLDNPGIRDFRDPKVIWHAPTQQWVMTLAVLNKVMFYSSSNLLDWKFLSEFGENTGSHDGVWECPDLFPLVDEHGNNHWVLIVNMNPGNPNGGSGIQYFIGDFDGQVFTLNTSFNQLLEKIPPYIPEGVLFEDFESGLDKWQILDQTFAISPNEQRVGKMISSGTKGFSDKGVMISEAFVIEKGAINFQIAGGDHRGKTLIGLEVDGRLVRQAEGIKNTSLVWKGWDVSSYIGKKAQLKIIDDHAGDWGYIAVDNITFANEVAHDEITGSVWLDAGADNYAGVTWSNIPPTDGRKIFIGWMSNWAYAQVVPTKNWRSAMTLPWALNILNVEGIPRLVGKPVTEVNKLRDGRFSNITTERENSLPENGLAEIEWIGNTESPLKIEVGNDIGEKMVFRYDPGTFTFELDRTQSGNVDFNPDFNKKHVAKRMSKSEKINLSVFLDHSSIEIFADDGLTVFTDLYFPGKQYNYLTIEGNGIGKIYSLQSIWK